MARSARVVAVPLVLVMGAYVAWVLVQTLRSGRFGAWHRDTSPVSYWLHLIIAVVLIVLCFSTLLLVVLHGAPRRRP